MAPLSDQLRQKAETVLEYSFRNPALLAEALTHSSVAQDRVRSNERMEFLGDAFLGVVVCEYLYQEYPEDLEGQLTKIKSAVVSRRVCAQISDKLGLTELLRLGKGLGESGPLPASLAAAVFESVVAAIYLDGGFEAVKPFLLRHMVPMIREAAASEHQDNYKSLLQQHAQKAMNHLPSYRVLDEKGPDHSKCFQVCVEIGGRRYAPAWAASKKQAEQAAAMLALTELGIVSESGEVVPADRAAPADQKGDAAC